MVESRRRGEALRRAICEAALAELRDSGYANLTMEAVAERARTGKAALYRRWPTKQALVVDALRTVLPDPKDVLGQQDVRMMLLAVLTVFNDGLAGTAGSPGIDAAVEFYRVPELREIFVEQVVIPRFSQLVRILREAADRGEIAPEGDVALIARTGPALVFYEYLITGAPPSKDELARIVDTVLIPLLRPVSGHQNRRSPSKHQPVKD